MLIASLTPFPYHTSMIPGIIRIATRKSPLAYCQAQWVQEALQNKFAHLKVELLGMLTKGDKFLATPLANIGGKGLFVKELENAILERQADIAVHSIKDMPAELADNLILCTICEREDPRDVLVSFKFPSLKALPEGAVVGTSSLRRSCQIKAMRPDLEIKSIRGNVGTRLRKLEEGEYGAIILAAAGLKRLDEQSGQREYFSCEQFIPAAGQGAIGIECNKDDAELIQYLQALDDLPTRYCVTAERAVNQRLGGGCHMPLAAHAHIEGKNLTIRGLIGAPDGTKILRASLSGNVNDALQLGISVAEDLLAQGAAKLIQ